VSVEFSGDARNKEESARLLGRLIRAADKLIRPYVAPMLQALTPKLKNSPPAVAACVLQTIGTSTLLTSHRDPQHGADCVCRRASARGR
jgi:FKBP12-rapamycin complex-associated protein